jgi:hypothetical protein
MLAAVIAGIAEFEPELIRERVHLGPAAAKARGKHLGRPPGQRPKSDRFAPKVLALVGKGSSYRLIGRELALSKNTVPDIVKHARVAAGQPLRGALRKSGYTGGIDPWLSFKSARYGRTTPESGRRRYGKGAPSPGMG